MTREQAMKYAQRQRRMYFFVEVWFNPGLGMTTKYKMMRYIKQQCEGGPMLVKKVLVKGIRQSGGEDGKQG